MKATNTDGSLKDITDCYIEIPALNDMKIKMNILPDISDSKSATYNDESGIGRSATFKGFHASDTRSISWTAHFFVCHESDIQIIQSYIRALEACVYPLTENTGGAPYAPPPICQLTCGDLLEWSGQPVCAVLKNYSIKFDTSVPWDEYTLWPYKTDIDLQFDVVYDQANLPGAEQIMEFGY